MADGFGVDTPQADQITGALLGVGGRISAGVTNGPEQGNTGSGLIEAAIAEFATAVRTATQNLAASIDKSATNFASLAQGAIALDQQEAERI